MALMVSGHSHSQDPADNGAPQGRGRCGQCGGQCVHWSRTWTHSLKWVLKSGVCITKNKATVRAATFPWSLGNWRPRGPEARRPGGPEAQRPAPFPLTHRQLLSSNCCRWSPGTGPSRGLLRASSTHRYVEGTCPQSPYQSGGQPVTLLPQPTQPPRRGRNLRGHCPRLPTGLRRSPPLALPAGSPQKHLQGLWVSARCPAALVLLLNQKHPLRPSCAVARWCAAFPWQHPGSCGTRARLGSGISGARSVSEEPLRGDRTLSPPPSVTHKGGGAEAQPCPPTRGGGGGTAAAVFPPPFPSPSLSLPHPRCKVQVMK